MAYYTASDVAACIIGLALERNKPVSNLQLQKILFFCQCAYLQDTGDALFDDEIVAWQYGPVVKNVYRMYSYRGASPILRSGTPIASVINYSHRPNTTLEGKAYQTVARTVDKWVDRPAWDLVNKSHRQGGAWDKVYNARGRIGSGYDEVIPLELMRQEPIA